MLFSVISHLGFYLLQFWNISYLPKYLTHAIKYPESVNTYLIQGYKTVSNLYNDEYLHIENLLCAKYSTLNVLAHIILTTAL